MRDRLPDLLHDRLTAESRAEVHAHLNTCADCRAELAVLEQVRAAAGTPVVDSSRIVAALPPYRAASPWQRMVRSPVLRAAAVILLVGGGALLVTKGPAPRRDDIPIRVAPVASTPGTPVTQTETRSDTAPALRPTPAPTSELAVGEMFHDLTDSELEALLAELNTLEALTPVETEVVAPAVNREGA